MMRVVRSLDEINRAPHSVVTVGTFDGVHRAHGEILREVVNRSRMMEGRSVVITFEPHPREVVSSSRGPVKLLSTLEERIARIGSLQIDVLLLLDFTYPFSRLSPREFYRDYVVRGVGAREVVVGYDHTFGRDREAGIAELIRMGQEFQFSVFAVHPFTVGGEVVSSTLIREALAAGDIGRAREFLGYPYAVSGEVVRGDGRGKGLGFPTANIRPHSAKKALPGRGVYLVGVSHGEKEYFGMMNIGVRPTVTEDAVEVLEVHLFDFGDDIYGETLTTTFLRKLRNEQRFASLEELKARLEKDKQESLRYLAEHIKR